MDTFKLLMVLSLTVLVGCGSSQAADKAKGGPPGGFATPVVGVKVTAQTIAEKVPVVGSLSANEAVELKSQIDGMVKEIKFEEGQKVAKDAVLVVLDRSKLDASLAEAKANAEMAETTFGRMRSLVESGAVSKQEFDQAQSDVTAKTAMADLLKAQLDDAVITAPFEGVAAERKVSVGQVIGKDTLLTVIIDGNPMKVDFHVPERYAGRLKQGQAVELSVAAYPGEVFKGDVYFIDPQIDDVSRTVLVKAKVPNDDNKLRRGMFAKLDLVIAEKENAVVIPETALIPNGETVMVFTVDAEGKAQMAPVQTGLRLSGKVEILSGLKVGDTIITEGYQKVGPGSPVSVVPPDAPKDAPKDAAKEEAPKEDKDVK